MRRLIWGLSTLTDIMRTLFVRCSILFLIATLAACRGAVSQKAVRQVAVTVDDLPAVGLAGGCNPAPYRDLTRRLLAKLDGIPATGFVNEGGRLCEELRLQLLSELLRDWVEEGHDLANHTYSHRAFENTGLEAFKLDVIRGEAAANRVLGEFGRRMRYFRYPMLHAPADSSEKADFEAFLIERGYRIAPVTFDNDEWIYARAYQTALNRGDSTRAEQIGDDYIRYMEEVFEFNEKFSVDLLGRELPQILLIHANSLNADYFGRVKDVLVRRGYDFVSLDEAMTDEAYSREDPYLGTRGLSWLQRLAVGIEGGTRKEPAAPQWVQAAAED